MRSLALKRAFWLIAFPTASLLTACGGGGGSSSEPLDIPVSGYHVSNVSRDYDNNGLPDATVSITYDSKGLISKEIYNYQDDGTPDKLEFQTTSGSTYETHEYTHYPNGLLESLYVVGGTQKYFSLYKYDSNGKLASVEETIHNGTSIYEQMTSLTYVDGLLISLKTELTASPYTETVRSSFTYDTNNRVATQTTETLKIFNTWTTQVTENTWTSDGKIDEINIDNNNDGNVDITIAYTYGSEGQLISRVQTNYADATQNSSSYYTYNSANIRTSEELDLGSDNTIDATLSMTVVNGFCQYSYGWALGRSPNFGYQETTDYTPGTGAYRLLACLKPDE